MNGLKAVGCCELVGILAPVVPNGFDDPNGLCAAVFADVVTLVEVMVAKGFLGVAGDEALGVLCFALVLLNRIWLLPRGCTPLSLPTTPSGPRLEPRCSRRAAFSRRSFSKESEAFSVAEVPATCLG